MLKNDPQVDIRGAPGANHAYYSRKTILKWKYVVRLIQIIFDSMKSDTEMEYFGAPGTIHV